MVMHFMMCNFQESFTKIYIFWHMKKCWWKEQKHYDFKSSAEHFLFKLLSFCNEWSYWYQIGLKLKLICSSFKKSKEGNFSLMVYHIGHEKNWSLDENLDQELIHSSQIDLKHQFNIFSQAFPTRSTPLSHVRDIKNWIDLAPY